MRARRGALIVIVLSGALGATGATGCGGKGRGGVDGSPTFGSIDVEPAQKQLTIQLGATAQQTYQVFGVNGTSMTDITASCTLSLDTQFGTFTGAVATINPHGGKTNVTAFCNGQSGTAELEVNLIGTVVAPNTPPGAAGTFAGAALGSDPTRAPTLQYPIDQAISPRNIPPIEVQWAASGNDLFHVAITSSYAAIDVYTTDVQATLAAADWDAVAGTSAGGPLSFTVEGLAQAAPQTKYASGAVKITMSHDIIDRTAIYYWASSQGSIMSETFGDTGAPTAIKSDCTACHSLSRSGSRLGYSRCVAGNCNTEWIGFMHYDSVAQKWNDTVDANNEQINGSFTTFAPVGYPYPDDSQSLAAVTMNGAYLKLYDPDTGSPIGSNLDTVSTHGPGSPRAALMADWSPDGKTIVYTSTPHPGQWIDLDGGSIATVGYTYTSASHVFTEPTFLVTSPITLNGQTYENLFFPSYSPDAKLIVFNAARASWRNFTDSKTAGQRLALTSATGGWVQDLTQMNGGTGDMDITWPHWAPGNTKDYYWIVFSSERDYGHEVTAANTNPACIANGVKQCKQIWIGAIAKDKLSGTVDPSAPPMWLPGQDPKTDNISPYWTVPVTVQ
jgi:hypothetical protein